MNVKSKQMNNNEPQPIEQRQSAIAANPMLDAVIKRTVKHCDGKTNVIAKGRIVNNEFVGEYRFEGMDYGVTIPEKETPAMRNYKHVLELMKGDEKSTRVCLRMMSWLINDIEINTDKDLSDYRNIWGKALEICKG